MDTWLQRLTGSSTSPPEHSQDGVIPTGTLVLLGKRDTMGARLVSVTPQTYDDGNIKLEVITYDPDGRQSHPQPVDLASLALPFTSSEPHLHSRWPEEWKNLNLQVGAIVLQLVGNDFAWGQVMDQSSNPAYVICRNLQTGVTGNIRLSNLSVPLQTWCKASWNIPLGTTIYVDNGSPGFLPYDSDRHSIEHNGGSSSTASRNVMMPLGICEQSRIQSPQSWKTLFLPSRSTKECTLLKYPDGKGEACILLKIDQFEGQMLHVHKNHLAISCEDMRRLNPTSYSVATTADMNSNESGGHADAGARGKKSIRSDEDRMELDRQLAQLDKENASLLRKLELVQTTNQDLQRKEKDQQRVIKDLKAEKREACLNLKLLRQELETSKHNVSVTNTELADAKDRIRKMKMGQKLMLNATSEHDYSSDFPSPGDLTKRIDTIESQLFTEWVSVALEEADIPWHNDNDAAVTVGKQRNFVLQVLFETTRRCHERVQSCVLKKAETMTAFLGGAHSRLAEDVALFERSAFHQVYKEMFAEIYPSSETTKINLAAEVFNELPVCAIRDDLPLNQAPKSWPGMLFELTRPSYVDMVMKLLMTFLECEIQRSDPLKFSEFVQNATWNPIDFKSKTFDPSDDGEGEKPTEGETRVTVVMPRLFWEKKDGSKVFETKASFVVCDDLQL